MTVSDLEPCSAVLFPAAACRGAVETADSANHDIRREIGREIDGAQPQDLSKVTVSSSQYRVCRSGIHNCTLLLVPVKGKGDAQQREARILATRISGGAKPLFGYARMYHVECQKGQAGDHVVSPSSFPPSSPSCYHLLMPFKASPAPRSWGTRFDTLTPPSPPRPPILHKISTAVNAGLDHSLNTQFTTSSIRTKEGTDTHDSSVFVGSLPTHVEHGELSQLLSEHLSLYAQIKGIKVIRDSKGGICAFVQCESAAAAANLIQTMRRQPEPFMGRYLRYEQARVFKSLLISYRVPMQVAPASRPNASQNFSSCKENIFELAPASDMRLLRPYGSKHVSILYNAEAQQYDQRIGLRHGADPAASDFSTNAAHANSLAAGDILLSPLCYDAETIYKIASFFGRVESCHLFQGNDKGEGGTLAYLMLLRLTVSSTQGLGVRTLFPTTPRGQPAWIRAVGKSNGSAEKTVAPPSRFVIIYDFSFQLLLNPLLQALRTVPHLTVTWAHSLGTSQNSHGRPKAYSLSSLPPRDFHASISRVANVTNPSKDSVAGSHPPSHLRTATYSTMSSEAGPSTTAGTVGSPASSRHTSSSDGVKGDTLQPQTTIEPTRGTEEGDWTVVHSPFHCLPNSSLKSPTSLVASPTQPSTSMSSTTCHEGNGGGFTDVIARCNETKPQWGDSELSSLSPLSVQSFGSPTRWGDTVPFINALVKADVSPELANKEITRRLSFAENMSTSPLGPAISPDACSGMPDSTPHDKAIREATRPVPLARLDTEPQNVKASFPPSLDYSVVSSEEEKVGKSGDAFGNKVGGGLRPVTIFAGGLEMYGPNAWDEAKVKSVFGKYGTILEATVIKPGHKKSAFAFITYEDSPSASRAMAEEHNKIYDGRQIRVQPHRGVWGPSSRGRPFRNPARRGIANGSDLGFASLQSPFGFSSAIRGTSDSDSNQHTGPTTPTPEPSLIANTISSQSSSVPTPAPAFPLPLSMLPPSGAAAAPTNYPTIPPAGYYAAPSPWFGPYPYVPLMPRYAPGHSVPVIPNSCSTNTINGNSIVYPPYTPYPTYPMYGHVVPPADPSKQVHTLPSGSQRQPPLLPTGFLQGEQGLVAMYQPEALNQYMTSNNTQIQSVPGAPDLHQESRQRSASTPTAGGWPSYGYSSFYPVHPPGSMPPTPVRAQSYPPPGYATPVQSMGWYPHPSMNPFPSTSQQQITPSPSRPAVHNPTPVNATSLSVSALFGTGPSSYDLPHGEANPSFKRRNRRYNIPSDSPHRHSDRAQPGFRATGNYNRTHTPSIQHPAPSAEAPISHVRSGNNASEAGVKGKVSSPPEFDEGESR
ncbi:hypothetical protein DENSPDRAFT_907517 [Dentipellis sp. KUC8613]|nr:hypothetical protein DENSPDRAFT_907517 [Dentipellis sp. KUC8613]